MDHLLTCGSSLAADLEGPLISKWLGRMGQRMCAADAFDRHSGCGNSFLLSSETMTKTAALRDSLSSAAVGDTASACARSALTVLRARGLLTNKFSRHTTQALNSLGSTNQLQRPTQRRSKTLALLAFADIHR